MCVAVPARVVKVSGYSATVALEDLTWEVRLELLPTAGPGDMVLVHAGFAIEFVDEQEARRMLDLLEEVLGWENAAP
ncbi:MAG: HypC/HybG/HupF family hydrogenase formation chaperone [Bacillota bacterium]